MKYLVQLKYTNPAHEHVSLRRRVDTVNRIVEAATEEEAINRIARQQRALGYLIQEAKVIDSDVKKEKEQLDEAKKPDASLVMRDELKNKMITDKDKQTLGKVAALMASQKKKDVKEEVEQMSEDQASDMQKIQSMDKGSMTGGKAELKTHLNYLKAMHAHQKKHGLDSVKTGKKIGDVNRALVQMGEEVEQGVAEEVEQVDEGSKRMSAAVKLQRAFDKEKTASDASRKRGEEMLVQARAEYAKRQAAKTNEEVEISEASKEGKSVMYGMRASMKAMDLRHGVDSDKRDSGYTMSPAVRAAQAKSDALSRVEKPVQAGTLAALKRRAMKTEAMDPNESKGEKKIVKTSKKAAKAAEKMVNAAKGKINKINIQPTMDIDVKSK